MIDKLYNIKNLSKKDLERLINALVCSINNAVAGTSEEEPVEILLNNLIKISEEK